MDIKDLLEKDDQCLNYLTLFNGKEIIYNDYLFYHQKAIDFSNELFNKYYDKEKSLEDNLKILGIKDILSMSNTQHMLYHARAIYLDDEKCIYINNEDLIRIQELIKKYEIEINDKQLRNIIIGHELFHHLENINNTYIIDYFKKEFGDNYYNEYREIAAHHFSCLVNNIKVQIIDLLWLLDKAENKLEGYIKYYEDLQNNRS